MATLIPITTGDLSDHQVGTDDVLVGLANATTVLFGDAGRDILDRAVGGNDTLTTSGPGSLYGDAGRNIADRGAGGDDTLTALIALTLGSATLGLNMYGDAGGNIADRGAGGD